MSKLTIAEIRNIEFFFRNPTVSPKSPDTVSQLYLLRREIDTCFGTDPNTGKPTNCPRIIWPGVMAILAGIDLLGKFLAGNDDNGGVSSRFKCFLTRYFKLSNSSDAEIIYQLRNSLLHSFGLYSEKKNNHGDIVAIYRFVLYSGCHQLVLEKDTDEYVICVDRLYNCFRQAINDYHMDLNNAADMSSAQLRQNFSSMFIKHGAISICNEQLGMV